MRLTVEFLGLARRLARTRETSIEIAPAASYRDVTRILAADFPDLVGPVIDPQTCEVVSSYMINLDGRCALHDYDAHPVDGQRLILMFVEAGG